MKNFFILIFLSIIFGCNQKPVENKTTLLSPTSSSKVFFKNINDGDTLESPFVVEMGVRGMKIKPAGPLEAGTGHHHIIVDKPTVKYGEVIPMDKNHLHYGKGDTTATLDLSTGKHSLTLQFANGLHMSYGKQYSKKINIYIK